MGDGGATVIPPSRRPDGTLRKEVRVRAGYVPQDEQPAYVPRQVQARCCSMGMRHSHRGPRYIATKAVCLPPDPTCPI